MKNALVIILLLFAVLGYFIINSFLIPKSPSADKEGGVQGIANDRIFPEERNNKKANLPSGPPQRVRIPSMEVDTYIEIVGLDSQGRMDVPKNADNVAWYQLGAKPGEDGNAVIAGHLDKVSGAPAVFYNLSSMKPGENIIIEYENGEEYAFKVTNIESYEYDQVPLDYVFGNSSKKRLNLITCEGSFDNSAKNYSHRIVVFSEIAD